MMNLMTIPLPIGTHLGGWRHPDAYPDTVMNLNVLIELAQIAEGAKLDAIFLADGNGVRDMDKEALFAANSPTARPVGFEPVTLFAALAQHTHRIGFVATATTSYEEPYTLARKFASLDHLSGGRAVWNVVTTSHAGDARNFGRADHIERGERYERAGEFVQVAKGLWDSWAEDAFPQDKAKGRWLDPTRVRKLDHRGKHFSVEGPLNVARSPQGRPILCMAGQSDAGKDLAAQQAECMFTVATSKAVAKAEYEDIKGRMAKFGRARAELRILPSLCVYLGETEADAEAFFIECQTLIPPAVGLDYLSSKVSHDLTTYSLDSPFPDLSSDMVGGTSQRTQISEMARQEGLNIRQVYERMLPSPGGWL